MWTKTSVKSGGRYIHICSRRGHRHPQSKLPRPPPALHHTSRRCKTNATPTLTPVLAKRSPFPPSRRRIEHRLLAPVPPLSPSPAPPPPGGKDGVGEMERGRVSKNLRHTANLLQVQRGLFCIIIMLRIERRKVQKYEERVVLCTFTVRMLDHSLPCLLRKKTYRGGPSAFPAPHPLNKTAVYQRSRLLHCREPHGSPRNDVDVAPSQARR